VLKGRAYREGSSKIQHLETNPNNPLEFVIPAQAGIQQKKCCEADKTSVLSASREEFNQLDSRLRGNDVIFDLMDNPG
jgi:hypothetical protein